jgi:hypothetical protein
VWLPGLAFLSLAVVRMRDAVRAQHLYRLLAPFAHRPVVLGAGGAVWGTVSWYLAELADVMGDGDAERRHRDAAGADLRRLGAAGWSASPHVGTHANEVSR